MTAETTPAQQRGRPFRPGESGNPAGRPKGSKHKLTEVFLSLITDDFAQHGAETIARLRAADPASYLKIIRALLPREMILQREQAPEVDYADMTYREIGAVLDAEWRRRWVLQLFNTPSPKFRDPAWIEETQGNTMVPPAVDQSDL